MYITHPAPKKRTIDDYDFLFTTGLVLPVTLDKEAGDSVDFSTHPLAVMIHLEAKFSGIDLDQKLPAEDITIFTAHLLSIQHRTREVEDLSPEQRAHWTQTLQEVSKTIQ